MAITSIPGKTRKVRFRFTGPSGVCVDGVDYGPNHVDAPVAIPAGDASRYEKNGKGYIVDRARDAAETPDGESLTEQRIAARRKAARGK